MKKILLVVLLIAFGGKSFAQNGMTSDDVYEYTGEYFSIVDEDDFSMNYHLNYSIQMKLGVRGCSFDMEVNPAIDEEYAIVLHFDGSAYPKKGTGWFNGMLDIREGKNRRSENVCFYWKKDIDQLTIYNSSTGRPVFNFSDLESGKYKTN